MCKISEAFFFILLSWFVAWHKYYISYINYCRALYTLLQSERNLPKRGVVPKGGAIEKLVAIVLCCNCTFVVFCCLFSFCHHTLSSYFFTFKLAFLAKRGLGKVTQSLHQTSRRYSISHTGMVGNNLSFHICIHPTISTLKCSLLVFLLLFSFWQNIIIHLGQWPLCGYQQAPLRFIPLLATARPVSSFCESYGKGKLLTETWKCRRISMSRDTQYPQKDTQPFEKVSDYLFFS